MAITSRAALRQYILLKYGTKSTVYNPYGWEQISLFVDMPLARIHPLDLERFQCTEDIWKNKRGVIFTLNAANASIKYYPRTLNNFILETGLTAIQAYANLSFNELQQTFTIATHDKVVKAQGKQIFGDWSVIEVPLDKVKYIHPAAFSIIGDSTAWVCFISHSRQKTHKAIQQSFNESLLYALAGVFLVAPKELKEMGEAVWAQRQPMGSTLEQEAQHLVDEVNEREAF